MTKQSIINIEEIPKVIVKTSEDMVKAAEVLSRLNKYMDGLVEEREKVTKPLNEALKAERARFKPTEDKLSEAIAWVRREMSRYETERQLLINKGEEAAAKKVAAGKISLEDAVAVAEKGSGGASVLATSSGTVKFRTDKVLRIVNAGKVPRKYLIVDEKVVLEVLKGGGVVLGCVLDVVQVPINRR